MADDDDLTTSGVENRDLPEMYRRDPNFGLLLAGGQPNQIAGYMATRGIHPPGEKQEVADWAGNLPSQGNLFDPTADVTRSAKGDRLPSLITEGTTRGVGAALAGGADRERSLLAGAPASAMAYSGEDVPVGGRTGGAAIPTVPAPGPVAEAALTATRDSGLPLASLMRPRMAAVPARGSKSMA